MDSDSWLFLAILIGGVTFWLVRRRLRSRRSNEAKRIAAEMGLTYVGDDTDLRRELFFCFPLFERGLRNSRQVTNIIRGHRDGLEVVLLDYVFAVRQLGWKNYRWYRQTICALRFPAGLYPEFEMRPRRFLEMSAILGERAIDFESNPEFSKTYRLHGKDESAVREAFRPGVLQYFMDRPEWCVEANGEWIVVYQLGRQVWPENLASHLQETSYIARLLHH